MIWINAAALELWRRILKWRRPLQEAGRIRNRAVLVEDVMRRELATIRSGCVDSAGSARDARSGGCAVPVLERARLIGVITDRDIAVRGIERPEPARLTARSKLTEAGRT